MQYRPEPLLSGSSMCPRRQKGVISDMKSSVVHAEDRARGEVVDMDFHHEGHADVVDGNRTVDDEGSGSGISGSSLSDDRNCGARPQMRSLFIDASTWTSILRTYALRLY